MWIATGKRTLTAVCLAYEDPKGGALAALAEALQRQLVGRLLLAVSGLSEFRFNPNGVAALHPKADIGLIRW